MTRRDLLWGGTGFGLTALSMRLPPALAATGPGEHRIGMARMRFGAVPGGIKAGDAIIWVNGDLVPHTATARDGSFDVVLPARQSRRMVVRRAGNFAFYCRYHPGMRGVLAVG